jgi:hypothetical protein
VALVVKAEQQVMNGLQSKMITQRAEVGAAAVVEGAEDAAVNHYGVHPCRIHIADGTVYDLRVREPLDLLSASFTT